MLNLMKGWWGEKSTQFGIWLTLDGTVYRAFHNLIVETHNSTTQIDHVVLSKFGLFVIETKHYQGWIYGSASQRQWTQVIYGSKYSFQNPLHQNYLHVRVLSEALAVDEGKIRSVVFFSGSAELKTPLPDNVLAGGLPSYIHGFKEVVFEHPELKRIEQELNRLSETTITHRQHVDNLKRRHAEATVCPRCGSALVERLARNGPRRGAEFIGCSSFPRCRYVRA